MSICTATTYIEPQPPTNLQQSDAFLNDRWVIDQSDIVAKLKTLEEGALSELRIYRPSFIEERITQLTQQMEKGLKDHIDLTIAQKTWTK